MSEIDFQSESTGYQKPKFDDVLKKLQAEGKDSESIISPDVLYGLSDISPEQLQILQGVWTTLSSSYKHKLIEALTEASEADFELVYHEIASIGMKDESSLVRAAAIDLMWEDESTESMRLLMNIVEQDESPNVKARALVALGKYILLGEYEEIPESLAVEAQELAIQFHKSMAQPLEVRRRALEALSNSSHAEKDKLIRDAYHSSEHLLKVSAVFAMGRTCDDKWQDILLDELDSSDNEIVYEAVRACGEIQLSSSIRQLGELLLGDDREIQVMAIWSLGEIGGQHALDILYQLQETVEDEELAEIIDEAVDVASFSLTGAMFDFDLDDDDF